MPRLEAELLTGFVYGKERAMAGEITVSAYLRKELSYQLFGRGLHNGVGGGDYVLLNAGGVRFQRQEAAFRNVPYVNVRPEVPHARMRIALIRGKALVIGLGEDIGEPKPNEWNMMPAVEVACHLFGYAFREAVVRGR
jgi:hypothetical protein